MEESHSDINAAFRAHRSVSSQWGDHHLLSSLIDIKNDLSTEVRALTKRMSHIDDQISQIFQFLSPLTNISTTDMISSVEIRPPTPPHGPSRTTTPPDAPISPIGATMSPDTNVTSVSMSPLFETPSFYSDLNTNLNLYESNQLFATTTDIHDHSRQSKTNEPIITTPPIRQIGSYDTIPLSALPSSIYNRSSVSSLASLGATTTPRSSVSNKIAPAPAPSSPVSQKNPLSTTFQPISNTRYNPGRSPKPKARSHSGRSSSKSQQQTPEKSTVIELEPSEQQEVPSKSAPLLGTSSKPTLSTKPSTSVFRRFMPGGNNPEKSGGSMSSTLLYPPTSDDERAVSPASSGNEDDDYRPLTSSSKHQTPL